MNWAFRNYVNSADSLGNVPISISAQPCIIQVLLARDLKLYEQIIFKQFIKIIREMESSYAIFIYRNGHILRMLSKGHFVMILRLEALH